MQGGFLFKRIGEIAALLVDMIKPPPMVLQPLSAAHPGGSRVALLNGYRHRRAQDSRLGGGAKCYRSAPPLIVCSSAFLFANLCVGELLASPSPHLM